MPLDFQKNISVFTQDGNIMLYGSAIRDVEISVKYYDIETGQETDGGEWTQKTGGFASGGTISLPSGKYEYKVYTGDVLVGVFPFELR